MSYGQITRPRSSQSPPLVVSHVMWKLSGALSGHGLPCDALFGSRIPLLL